MKCKIILNDENRKYSILFYSSSSADLQDKRGRGVSGLVWTERPPTQ